MVMGRIPEHQRVFAHLVFEIVIDALQLHQAADEVEAAFVVLHAVAPQAIVAGQLIFQLHVVLRQQSLDDLRHRLFWKMRKLRSLVIGHRSGCTCRLYTA